MANQRASGPTNLATNLVTLLLVLACVFTLYLVGAAIIGALNGGRDVAVHQEVSYDRLGSLPPSVLHSQSAPVTIRIRDADTGQLLGATARDLVVVALGLSILWLVRRLLLSVREGDPFTTANVRRLRAIGFLLVIGFPIGGVIVQFLEGWLASGSSVGELGTTFLPDVSGPLVAGLGVFTLAEVFAHGARLREDVEGTV